MAVPTIDPQTGVLSYPQWLTWAHQFSATNAAYDWNVAFEECAPGRDPYGFFLEINPEVKP